MESLLASAENAWLAGAVLPVVLNAAAQLMGLQPGLTRGCEAFVSALYLRR